MTNRIPSIMAAACTSGFLLAGCSIENNYGVDIHNNTGQPLLVEFLNVASDGSTSPYSTGRLAPKGTFSNKVTDAEKGFGKRVRFSLPDRPPDDPAGRVELKLSDEGIRTYNLVLNNGRLTASELPMGRRPVDTSDK